MTLEDIKQGYCLKVNGEGWNEVAFYLVVKPEGPMRHRIEAICSQIDASKGPRKEALPPATLEELEALLAAGSVADPEEALKFIEAMRRAKAAVEGTVWANSSLGAVEGTVYAHPEP
jgi:hypothetical protein